MRATAVTAVNKIHTYSTYRTKMNTKTIVNHYHFPRELSSSTYGGFHDRAKCRRSHTSFIQIFRLWLCDLPPSWRHGLKYPRCMAQHWQPNQVDHVIVMTTNPVDKSNPLVCASIQTQPRLRYTKWSRIFAFLSNSFPLVFNGLQIRSGLRQLNWKRSRCMRVHFCPFLSSSPP